LKHKLDFHCHTIASDGGGTIPELISLARTAGLSALILTDHCYTHHCRGSYFQNLTVIETLRRNKIIDDFPIIVGSEIGTPYSEFLLFGPCAIRSWYENAKELERIKDPGEYWLAFKERVVRNYDYAMIMCHPASLVEYLERLPDTMYELLHGFEINNSGVDYLKHAPEVVKCLRSRIAHPRELCNSDCHDQELGEQFNEVDIDKVSEKNVVNWLRRK